MTTPDTTSIFIHEILQRQAAQRPTAICLYPENGPAISYAQLWSDTQAAALWMKNLGVSSGHKVMVISENCQEAIVMLFACSVIGAWPVGINARLSTREIDTIAQHCDPKLLFFTGRISAAATEHAAARAALPCDSTAFAPGNQYALLTPATPSEPKEISQAVATLIYTSGTTGAPKGVMVSHKGLLHFAGVSASARRLVPTDIAYAALPISHVFGLATVLMATFQAGASLILRSKFDVNELTQALVTPGVSLLQGVPTMFVRLLSAAGDQPHIHAPMLRYVYASGAALDPALKAKVEALFRQPLHHGFGITEYAGSVCVTDIDQPRADCSSGCATPGVQVEIRRDGRAVPSGEKGNIVIKGPGIMLGYYRDPELTRAALLPEGWLDTGDIGYLDDGKALFITGRSKDVIIRSGFNVYPLEVEAVINAFDGIRLSAVVGRQQADGNEEVVAFYETEADFSIDEQALSTYLAASLAPYKRPAQLIKIEQMPTTPNGKIQKAPLRARLKDSA